MELGERIRQARLEAGLSQRQLCGDTITRNMLSLIENGSARPSMDTLCFLAERLGKSVSFFLEEDAVLSPNQAVMERARDAWLSGRYEDVGSALEEYREPDPVFRLEKRLLHTLAVLTLAEAALEEGRTIYAGELLDRAEIAVGDYCAPELGRRLLLLKAEVCPGTRREACAGLPSLDGELLVRARDALDRGDFDRSGALLDAAEDKADPRWSFLRGEVYLALSQYTAAAEHYHKAEQLYPQETAVRLERCYRELEDYRQAYFYACKQRK